MNTLVWYWHRIILSIDNQVHATSIHRRTDLALFVGIIHSKNIKVLYAVYLDAF